MAWGGIITVSPPNVWWAATSSEMKPTARRRRATSGGTTSIATNVTANIAKRAYEMFAPARNTPPARQCFSSANGLVCVIIIANTATSGATMQSFCSTVTTIHTNVSTQCIRVRTPSCKQQTFDAM